MLTVLIYLRLGSLIESQDKVDSDSDLCGLVAVRR